MNVDRGTQLRAKRIAKALDELDKAGASTGTGVASVLRQKGIKGKRQRHDRCPITNYLHTQTGLKTAQIMTMISGVESKPPGPPTDWGHTYVKNPTGIQEFIQRFDRCEWPELIEP